MTISRNSDGFPCPCCKNYYKTGKTLKDHLTKKQLKCTYIYDTITDAGPQAGSIKSSLTIPSSIPASQYISSPVSMPNQISDINTSPLTTDDRLIFNLIDISARFHSFKKEVNNSIQQGITITVEEHLQHLLALSSILLLKPARTHKDLHAYIDLNTCDELCHHIIENHKTTNQLFPTEVKLQLEEIMLQLDVVNLRKKPE